MSPELLSPKPPAPQRAGVAEKQMPRGWPSQDGDCAKADEVQAPSQEKHLGAPGKSTSEHPQDPPPSKWEFPKIGDPNIVP